MSYVNNTKILRLYPYIPLTFDAKELIVSVVIGKKTLILLHVNVENEVIHVVYGIWTTMECFFQVEYLGFIYKTKPFLPENLNFLDILQLYPADFRVSRKEKRYFDENSQEESKKRPKMNVEPDIFTLTEENSQKESIEGQKPEVPFENTLQSVDKDIHELQNDFKDPESFEAFLNEKLLKEIVQKHEEKDILLL